MKIDFPLDIELFSKLLFFIVSMFIVKYPTYKPKKTEELVTWSDVNKSDEQAPTAPKMSEIATLDCTLNDTSNDCEAITNAVAETFDKMENNKSQVIHKTEFKFNIVNNLASISNKTTSDSSQSSEDEIQLTEISQMEPEKKEEVQESLPLIESYNFSNDENDSFEIKCSLSESHEDKEMKDFFDDIQDLQSLLKIADKKIQSLSSDKDTSVILQDDEDTEMNSEDTDSLSSIEGSLKGVLTNEINQTEASSSPLIHLYPKLGKLLII